MCHRSNKASKNARLFVPRAKFNSTKMLHVAHPRVAALSPTLSVYLKSELVKSAHFDPERKCYVVKRNGAIQNCAGLKSALKKRYYSHYRDNRSRRKWKSVQVKGSSSAQGKRIDKELSWACAGKLDQCHPMTTALLAYWEKNGHTLVAAQVPVAITAFGGRVTQADILTVGPENELYVWELKTGMPVGFNRTQQYFSKGSGADTVKCTKLNIWHLQLVYTVNGLKAAGVPVAHARIIQIYDHKKKGLEIKVHEPPSWINELK